MAVKTTPMMQQWNSCKEKSKGAVLLFRLGDFYEAFYEDAAILARDLGLTLTKRQGIPMSGVPFHAAENYIDKLITKGHLVAIAEQVENPKEVKGIVKRDVVRLLSPGAVYNPSLLSDKANNYFVSITKLNAFYGLSALDVSTGEFKALELNTLSEVRDEIFRLSPKELLLSEKFYQSEILLFEDIKTQLSLRITKTDNWRFDDRCSFDYLTRHFSVHNLDGFGLKGKTSAVIAAGALLCYFEEDLSQDVSHIVSLENYSISSYMQIDQMTQRNLELFGKGQFTLLHLMDHTLTAMGGRLLKSWIARPLLDVDKIKERQEATKELLDSHCVSALHTSLNGFKDVERLIMRVRAKQSTPKDLAALRESLEKLPAIKALLEGLNSSLFVHVLEKLFCVRELTEKIEKTLVEDPPIKIQDKDLIRQGVDKELDELKELKSHSEDFLLKYQERLRVETGIKTLKVGFNKAFGYFIEVSRLQSKNTPPYFHKKQTLVNNERFITEELRGYENKILGAEEKILTIESRIYEELKSYVLTFEKQIRFISKGIAHLDCILCYTHLAQKSGYTCPIVDDSDVLSIKDGRHPVIETSDIATGFIPNDTDMDTLKKQLFVITGPNMAGKSTYIRQVGLLSIMAHMGCYIPAKEARIGLIDQVFSRIGASDDLSRGLSTFMVEMTETANILRHATQRSLVILDEIGRGTSTYDGISIASSVAEYLLTNPSCRARTLFATHYFELTKLEDDFEGALNYNVSVDETDKGIVFLRKIVRGGADKSYGIHVAKLAGLPHSVLKRAEELLEELEQAPAAQPSKKGKKKSYKKSQDQMLLFSKEDTSFKENILQELKECDLAHLTPVQGLTLLEKWKSLLN
ncbi:MAG: DNA mismatch repair protein MutS [Chlamydiia bacterium]|nr:DNA mismatch repair protein MutS [Chlamydiia bacterium]